MTTTPDPRTPYIREDFRAQLNEQQSAARGQDVRIANIDNDPVPVRQPTWFVVLAAVKNVVCIVTCVAVLYALWVAYQVLQAFGDAAQSVQDGLNGIGN